MKILHFAIENYGQIPFRLVREERKAGHESLLVTLYKTGKEYNNEDFCLNLPFVGSSILKTFKKYIFSSKSKITNLRRISSDSIHFCTPTNRFEKVLHFIRDAIWQPKVKAFLKKININNYDIIILDGGAGFLRSGNIINELYRSGKKIICNYYGSDLRTRGIFKEIDEICYKRFTFEFDHKLLVHDINFLFFPFDASKLPSSKKVRSKKIRIGHAPTNREAKGSNIILEELNKIKQTHPIEIVLIENMNYNQAIKLKSTCDIFVDQIGELGYGINSLESMCMGIPTAVELQEDFEEFIGDHPFININSETISKKLIPFIESESLRHKTGIRLRKWVREHHDHISIGKEFMQKIGIDKIAY